MTGILDRYIIQSRWVAESIDDVFAIALAARMDDRDGLSGLRHLSQRHAHDALARAANHLSAPKTHLELRRRIETPLQLTSNPEPRVVAIKIERKVLAAVVLRGTCVVRTETRNLAYDDASASRAAAGLVGRLAQDCPNAVLAFDPTGGSETRRGRILQAAVDVGRSLSRPILDVQTSELLQGFSVPAVRTRSEMRGIVRSLFGHLEGIEAAELVDALAVGLCAYCRLMLERARGEEP